MSEPVLTLAELQAACAFQREHLLALGATTADALGPWMPGGGENPDTGPRGWLFWYGYLHRCAGREQARDVTEGTTAERQEREVVVREALRGSAARVELLSPVPGENGDLLEAVQVYPKGITAHTVLAELDAKLGFLAGHLAAAAGSPDAKDLEARVAARERMHQLLLRATWISVTPGAGLPFDPVAEPEPVSPPWLAQLNPADVHRIATAFQGVNAGRLLALNRLEAPDSPKGAHRPNWSMFAASAAMEFGLSARVIMDEHDVPAVVAKMRLAAIARDRALKAAKKPSATAMPAGGRFG